MVTAPLVMPEVITGLSLLLLFVAMQALIGWPEKRGITTITIAHATFSLSYVAVIVQSRLTGLDESIEEAALDLGARPLKVFFAITLPLIAPALISGWLLSVHARRSMTSCLASFVSGPGSSTLPMVIFSKVRLGVSPEINALATIMVSIVTSASSRRDCSCIGRSSAAAATSSSPARPDNATPGVAVPRMTAGIRIAMWSGPRNISTALMRSFGNRPDTWVSDEPFYAHYLEHTGRDHPGARKSSASRERLARGRGLADGADPEGKAVWYQKHMSHHLLPHMEREWMLRLTHAFLIRSPRENARVARASAGRARARGHRPAAAGGALRLARVATGQARARDRRARCARGSAAPARYALRSARNKIHGRDAALASGAA
jgi:hypothetical protein